MVRVIDAPALFVADGVPVWVAPDLVYTIPGERTTIVDWKTGKEDASAVDQLCLYAWYVRDALGIPMGCTGYEGRVVELATGTEYLVDLTSKAIDDARRRLHASVAAMRELLQGPEDKRPKTIESFPLAEQRNRCPSCNYWELCESEIQNACSAGGDSLDQRARAGP
jgi:predicted RecB family nuclease